MPNVEPLREGDPAAVGPYRLVGRLGAGGHGVVYLGQARNGTPVAVKVLREGLAVGARLAKEIAAARKVEPFCLAQVLDASTSGRPYIVSEYVDGPSLQQAGRRGGAELQRLAVATATALDAIHQAGVVHGDFTPSNVLLGPDGAQVVDFGIAGALGSGMKATSNIVGTPAYMAPEQLAGKAVGAAADVFGWAAVLVYAATGVPPFGDDALPVVINRILREEPQLGELGRPLRDIVSACLAKDPAARPPMRDVLLRLAAPSRRPSTPYAAPHPGQAASDQAASSEQPSARPTSSEQAAAWQQTLDQPATRYQGYEQTPDRSWEAAQERSREQAADPADPAAGRDTAAHQSRSQGAPGRPHAPGQPGGGTGQGLPPRQAGSPHQGTAETPIRRRPRDQHQQAQAAHQAMGGPHQGSSPHQHPADAHHGMAPGAHQDSGQDASPLQALFDLASPVESQNDGNGQGPHGQHGQGPHGPHGPGPHDRFAHGADAHDRLPQAPPAGPHEAGAGTSVESGGAAPPRSRGRRVKTVLIAAVSAVCVCALAMAIVWLTPTTPTPKTKNIAVVGNPTTAPATPSPGRTRSRATPQTDGTPSTVPSDGEGVTATPAADVDRLRVMYVRAGGTKDGDCWTGGEVSLRALVRRAGGPVTFSYTWLIDGASAGRASAVISENGQRYLTSPRTLQSTTGGTHSVTLRITAPVTAERTVSVMMCDPATY
ncbi:serine/threonine-protein kinase [Nonomuraea insulae]|uniref:non-specific serine/threonine protein kinase n=1 Tax=Nonomuraea insulae TaxID=1616787 RepID=A0ABW1D4K6_9ACTN